jgi:hypothetical protein
MSICLEEHDFVIANLTCADFLSQSIFMCGFTTLKTTQTKELNYTFEKSKLFLTI